MKQRMELENRKKRYDKRRREENRAARFARGDYNPHSRNMYQTYNFRGKKNYTTPMNSSDYWIILWGIILLFVIAILIVGWG
jgi:hypothetical protein